MWLMLLAFVLVSGVVGWATWLFLIFAAAAAAAAAATRLSATAQTLLAWACPCG
jgi:D-alanyl-lipoteichoic acid acyltransferase DltB (MBOAT superfamily)